MGYDCQFNHLNYYMTQLTTPIVIIAILAICSGLKSFRLFTTNRYIPLIAIGISLIISYSMGGGFVLGLIIGLASVGLYSGWRSVFFNK